MDINKPPGVSFDDIILKELIFSRKKDFSERPELAFNLESHTSFSQDETQLVYELVCKIQDKNELFNISCTMVGFFSTRKGQENMGLKEYSEINAPATIFPYIREAISSTTTKAGIPPIIIPPMNISLLKKQKKDNNQEA